MGLAAAARLGSVARCCRGRRALSAPWRVVGGGVVVGRVAAVRIEWLAVAARDATRGFEVCVAAWLRLACANVHFGRVRACGWLGGWLAGWLAG